MLVVVDYVIPSIKVVIIIAITVEKVIIVVDITNIIAITVITNDYSNDKDNDKPMIIN